VTRDDERIVSSDPHVGPVYDVNILLAGGIEIIVRKFDGFTPVMADKLLNAVHDAALKVMSGD
jgi:hypothetical protein